MSLAMLLDVVRRDIDELPLSTLLWIKESSHFSLLLISRLFLLSLSPTERDNNFEFPPLSPSFVYNSGGIDQSADGFHSSTLSSRDYTSPPDFFSPSNSPGPINAAVRIRPIPISELPSTSLPSS
jgi:hypothetical protein